MGGGGLPEVPGALRLLPLVEEDAVGGGENGIVRERLERAEELLGGPFAEFREAARVVGEGEVEVGDGVVTAGLAALRLVGEDLAGEPCGGEVLSQLGVGVGEEQAILNKRIGGADTAEGAEGKAGQGESDGGGGGDAVPGLADPCGGCGEAGGRDGEQRHKEEPEAGAGVEEQEHDHEAAGGEQESPCGARPDTEQADEAGAAEEQKDSPIEGIEAEERQALAVIGKRVVIILFEGIEDGVGLAGDESGKL